MHTYPRAAAERMMKIQEVILRAMAKKITWWQAGEIIGRSDRQMQRLHWRHREHGYDGLLDLAVRAVAVRSSAGALVLHKRAGQHFPEQPETTEESAAQLKIRITGHKHHGKTEARKTGPQEAFRLAKTSGKDLTHKGVHPNIFRLLLCVLCEITAGNCEREDTKGRNAISPQSHSIALWGGALRTNYLECPRATCLLLMADQFCPAAFEKNLACLRFISSGATSSI